MDSAIQPLQNHGTTDHTQILVEYSVLAAVQHVCAEQTYKKIIFCPRAQPEDKNVLVLVVRSPFGLTVVKPQLNIETLRLTFMTNRKRQTSNISRHSNFHTCSTAKLLIHASILMQNTVQIVLNSNTRLLKAKYDLKFAVCSLP